jgi:glycosyltransferase involved in cell wall biosynthesis
MKKICILSQYWLPDLNGDVIRLKNCIKALINLGYEVTLITSLPHYPYGDRKGYKSKPIIIEKGKNIKIIRVYIPPLKHEGLHRRLILYVTFTFTSLFPLFILNKADYIWAFSQRIFSSISGIIFKIFHKSKLVSDITDLWPEALVNTGYTRYNSIFFKVGRFLAKIVYLLSDKVTVLTDSMKDFIAKEYKIEPKKIEILPNIAKKHDCEENISKDKLRIVYSGNLGKNYDLISIIEVAKILNNEKIEFIIRGQGEMYSILSKLIKEYDLKNVKIENKPLPYKEYLKEMCNSDIFILPLKSSMFPDASFPIKFVEYLGFGKPMLIISKGYLAKFSKEKNIGFVFEEANHQEIASLLIKISKEKNSLKEFKLRNFKVLDEYFSENKLKKAIKKIFE